MSASDDDRTAHLVGLRARQQAMDTARGSAPDARGEAAEQVSMDLENAAALLAHLAHTLASWKAEDVRDLAQRIAALAGGTSGPVLAAAPPDSVRDTLAHALLGTPNVSVYGVGDERENALTAADFMLREYDWPWPVAGENQETRVK